MEFIEMIFNYSYDISLNFQISSAKGPHSLVFHLTVVSPQAHILSPGSSDEFHLVRGSTISLTCVVEKAPSPPQ